MTIPYPFVHIEGPVAGQNLRPDLDVGVAGWEEDDGSTVTLWTAVSTMTDADYVRPITPGLSVCPTTENDSVEFGIEDPTEVPVDATDTVVVRVRARYNMLIGGTGEATMRIRLREGATTRATGSGFALTTAFAWYEDVLSASEVDAIGDWTNLRILADADVCVDTVDDEVSFEISQMEVDIN